MNASKTKPTLEGEVLAPETRCTSTIARATAKKIGLLYKKAKQCLADSLRAYRECGAMLAEQKAKLEHGSWLIWLRANEQQLGMKPRTAQALIRLAANAQFTADLTEAEAAKLLRETWGNERKPKPTPAPLPPAQEPELVLTPAEPEILAPTSEPEPEVLALPPAPETEFAAEPALQRTDVLNEQETAALALLLAAPDKVRMHAARALFVSMPEEAQRAAAIQLADMPGVRSALSPQTDDEPEADTTQKRAARRRPRLQREIGSPITESIQ